MSETGVVAYIGSFPYPKVIRDINAFQLGMRSVNPNAGVRVVWINSWDNPQQEMEADHWMSAQGADVLTAHNDSVSVIIAAERAGVYSIAYSSDMSVFSSKQLTAIVQNWTPYFSRQANAVRDGTFKVGTYWGDVVAFNQSILLEDLPILASQRPRELPLYSATALSVPSDSSAIEYRRYLKRLGVGFSTC